MEETRRTAGTGGTELVTRCQICDSAELDSVLFLGYLPPVNQMRTIGARPDTQPGYPAEWLICRRCRLIQLGLVVDPEILFPPEYPYTSGTTKILRDNFADLAAEAREVLGTKDGDLVIDVGSNDGTLLSAFKERGFRVHGIEPANVGHTANERGIPTTVSFFTGEVAARVKAQTGPAKIVTATNVFAHIEHVHDIVEAILLLLDGDGVFISESHYAIPLVETLQYDTIYHEHLRYYSLESLRFLLDRHGLEIIHTRRIPTHGGSIRVYAAPKGTRPVLPTVAEEVAREESAGIDAGRLKRFRNDVVLSKLGLHELLASCKRAGARIFGVGAPSRASTLINYVGIDDGILDCVVEVAGSLKVGKYMPGTLIPVVEESRLFEEQPEYALMLSWHIADELIPKLKAKGFRGKYIVPLPEVRIVE